MSILMAIIVFGLIILIHEIGHFVAARRYGIMVEEFAIGMGPKLVGLQRGETLYTIRALPIGGFCKMYGDEADPLDAHNEHLDHEALKDRSLNSKPIYQRIAVMFAGSFMNFILAFLLFIFITGATGLNTTTMMRVGTDTPAYNAGLSVGDRITHLNGSRIFLWDDIAMAVNTGYGQPIVIGFIRDGVRHNITITPEWDGNRYLMGVSPERRTGLFTDPPEGFYRANIIEVLTDSFMRIGFVIRMIVSTLVRLVTAPHTVMDQLAGPIGIVNPMDGYYQATVQAAEQAQASTGMLVLSLALTMANFGAVISSNLAIFNLLPLPALDGGRIVFLLLEGIRRKPISPEREGMVHLAGFVILMVLMVLIAYQDIINLL